MRYRKEGTFISAGGYHHQIVLNTWQSKGGKPAPKNSAGLFHTAILCPTQKDLTMIIQRLIKANYPLTGAGHGVSEALYLDDPDENGVELYWDRPRDFWSKDENGELTIYTRRFDLECLMREVKYA